MAVYPSPAAGFCDAFIPGTPLLGSCHDRSLTGRRGRSGRLWTNSEKEGDEFLRAISSLLAVAAILIIVGASVGALLFLPSITGHGAASSTFSNTATTASCRTSPVVYRFTGNETTDYLIFLQNEVELNATVTESTYGSQAATTSFNYVWENDQSWNLAFRSDKGVLRTISVVNPGAYLNHRGGLAVRSGGQTLTRTSAEKLFDSYMGIFHFEKFIMANVNVFTDPRFFHQTGNSSFQGLNMTAFAPNALPEQFNECGITANISDALFKVSLSSFNGKSFAGPLPEYIHSGDTIT